MYTYAAAIGAVCDARTSLFEVEVELDVVEDGKGDHEGDRPCEVSIHF